MWSATAALACGVPRTARRLQGRDPAVDLDTFTRRQLADCGKDRYVLPGKVVGIARAIHSSDPARDILSVGLGQGELPTLAIVQKRPLSC